MAAQQARIIDPEDAFHLSIGGQRFTTSCAVLRRGAPEFFDSVMSGQYGKAHHDDPGRLSKPEVLIDRDPRHFHAVLNFLRSGRGALPDTIQGLLELRAEAEAYQVQRNPFLSCSNSMSMH